MQDEEFHKPPYFEKSWLTIYEEFFFYFMESSYLALSQYTQFWRTEILALSLLFLSKIS